LQEPVLGALRVGDGLLGGEGLGSDDEDGRLRVAELQDLGEVGSVNVGDEVRLEVSLRVVLERLADHHRSEVGSTDTDVDDGVDALAGVTLPCAGSDLLGELLDVVQHLVHVVARALLVNLPTALGRWRVSESNVQDRSALGRVDVLSRKHGITEGLDLGLTGELEKG